MKRCVPLEAAAEVVCSQNSTPPLIFQLPPEQGRRMLEKAQDSPVYLYPADISVHKMNTGKWGAVPVYFVIPQESIPHHVIFYIHGAGWVFGCTCQEKLDTKIKKLDRGKGWIEQVRPPPLTSLRESLDRRSRR